MSKIKILYVCEEMMPYVSETEISKICRQLPQLAQENGCDIRTFMPRFGTINERRNQLHEVIRLSGMNIVINDTDHQLIIKVASIPNARVQVYFIDNEDFFQRKAMLYDDEGVKFEDNDERAIFFTRGVIETVSKLRWSPEIIHCHEWFTAFMPAYIKHKCSDDPLFSSAKIILSIYNNSFDGTLDEKLIEKLRMEGFKDENLTEIGTPTYNNVIKFALQFLDGIIIAGDDVDPEIIEYAKNNGVKVLEYSITNPDYINKYMDFYNEILSK